MSPSSDWGKSGFSKRILQMACERDEESFFCVEAVLRKEEALLICLIKVSASVTMNSEAPAR
jgi:hypothetical protein